MLLFMLLVFYSVNGSASQEIVCEGSYNMGDSETPAVAENRALLNAKRTAIEQAGTYVKSYSKVIQYQLTEDEIAVIASGSMKVEVLEKKRTVVGDGINFRVKIRANIIPDKIEKLSLRSKDNAILVQYKLLKNEYENSQKEIESLKKQLKVKKGNRELIEQQIRDDEKNIQAREWYIKGYEHFLNGEYDDVITAYTMGINIRPYHWAHFGRGFAYNKISQFDNAIQDLSLAIALNPNEALYYAVRGQAYGNNRKFETAMKDYNRAISIDPNCSTAYRQRGLIYGQIALHHESQKQYQQAKRIYALAIHDLTKAMSLSPYDPVIYAARGMIKSNLGYYNQAIEDFNTAIKFETTDSTFYLRGKAYEGKGDLSASLADYNKAIEINSNNAGYYVNRAFLFHKIGNNRMMLSDLNSACNLGVLNGT